MRLFSLLLAAAAVPAALAAQAVPASPQLSSEGLVGTWTGALSVGAMQVHLVFHIRAAAGGLAVTLDSPDQGALGLPTSACTLTGSTLRIEAAALHALFSGTVAPDLSSIAGNWSQGGNSLPLVLTRLKEGAALPPRRWQTPAPPFPYRSIEVSYTNPQQHDVLAATLTLPPGPGPFPAVLLITGSGPQDRDETILGHKPFLVLADYLTRRGIAVLRADDRGTGESTGDFAAATTADFATDAEAGFVFLRARPEIDARRVGLLGHSEGAIIAPMIAAHRRDVAFLVLLAGSGVPGAEIIAQQQRLINQASGMPPAELERSAAEERALLQLVLTEKDPAALDAKLHALLKDQMSPQHASATIRSLESPWFRYFLAYDPAPALRKVTCPVLALDGSLDLQVPPAEYLTAIQAALAAGGNTHVTVHLFPGLNHLFQTAKTGLPGEYASIEETMAPAVLDAIGTWILQQR